MASSGAQPSPATPSPLTPPSDSYSQTQSELNTLKRRLLSLAVADTDGSGGLGASAASQGVALAGDAADALRLQIAQLTRK